MTADHNPPASQMRIKTLQTNPVKHAEAVTAKEELIKLIESLSDSELEGFRAATITLVM